MEDEIIVVTCGTITGKLHREKFLCPGIHQSCIETEDGSFVTPKMFSVMGDKEKLKDWKNAIRINGTNFRKMMDTGQLDFFNHSVHCSGRCIARTPLTVGSLETKTTKPEISLNPPTMTPVTQAVFNPIPELTEHAYSSQSRTNRWKTDSSSSSSMSSKKKSLSQAVFPHAVLVSATGPVTFTDDISNQDSGGSNSDKEPGINNNGSFVNGDSHDSEFDLDIKPSADELQKLAMAACRGLPGEDEAVLESQLFWRGIMEVGLLDEFFREIKQGLDTLKNSLIKSKASEAEANRINRIVEELGLTAKFKVKLSACRSETEKLSAQLSQEMEDLRRKALEIEQKKAQLKRKSVAFEQLLESKSAKRTPTASLWVSANGKGDEQIKKS
ncbi:glucocorticoid modulatory element-binding protein 1 [Lingula anatina]|uniref:Glucocorticoid modulatory element-binding protein 1 n=1 Tax=Lingula anatina TaxID=7574 RepID=A0A1S3K6Y0_LINAN|nr:glucocorticoid modulatory element-binding protein 1 [Lingula anatina]|eukprot:XP_013418388.1 glucocorticoid modulatory element-binding protein 1 [Lingula anatina]